METRMYVCNYCKKEYIPKRRRVQKYCSNSCRVGSHQLEKRISKTELTTNEDTISSKKTKIDQMSIAGVGNAALGTFAVDALKAILTKEENKPATKGDLKKVLFRIEQIQENMKKENDVTFRNPFFNS